MELFGKRVDSIRDAITPSLSARQRMAQENVELSRLAYYRELVSIADETLFKLASVLYEVDDQAVLINVDPVTHRILLPLPWGDDGWRIWKAFRHNEAVALRGVLLARVRESRWVPLFDYNDTTRKWHLSAKDYGNAEHAQGYLKSCPIQVSEWRQAADAYRSIKSTSMQQHRNVTTKSK